MLAGADILIDLLHGRALLGDVVVPVAGAGPEGELQVGGPDGPLLRPLRFGERMRIAMRARLAPDPRAQLCEALLQAATVRPGAADPLAQRALALALAGADQDAPPFVEALLLVGRAASWDLAQIQEAGAIEIDQLALYLGQTQDDGWNSLLIADRETGSLEQLCAGMADRLLGRAAPGMPAPLLERAPDSTLALGESDAATTGIAWRSAAPVPLQETAAPWVITSVPPTGPGDERAATAALEDRAIRPDKQYSEAPAAATGPAGSARPVFKLRRGLSRTLATEQAGRPLTSRWPNARSNRAAGATAPTQLAPAGAPATPGPSASGAGLSFAEASGPIWGVFAPAPAGEQSAFLEGADAARGAPAAHPWPSEFAARLAGDELAELADALAALLDDEADLRGLER